MSFIGSFYGLVLAGGFSQRMKQDKSLIQFDDQTLAQRACEKLSGKVEKVFLSIRAEQLVDHQYLEKKSIQILIDDYQNIGPTAALLAAHKFDKSKDWLVLACDFAKITTEDVKYLVGTAHAQPQSEVICYQNKDGFLEPLFAVWRSQALRQLQAEVASGNETGPGRLIQTLSYTSILPLENSSFLNLNYPCDLEALRGK